MFTHTHTHSFSTSCVIPDSVVGELHGVSVLCFLKVLVGMSADVATATNVPADQTNPQVLQRTQKHWAEKDKFNITVN